MLAPTAYPAPGVTSRGVSWNTAYRAWRTRFFYHSIACVMKFVSHYFNLPSSLYAACYTLGNCCKIISSILLFASVIVFHSRFLSFVAQFCGCLKNTYQYMQQCNVSMCHDGMEGASCKWFCIRAKRTFGLCYQRCSNSRFERVLT